MYTIQAAGVVLAIASSALAAQGCVPNALELTNLRRHHDINTGSTFAGQQVTRTQLRVAGGTGCSPVWAGGSYDDSALFEGGEYPEALKRSIFLGSEGVLMRELAARHGPGDGMPMPKTPKRRHSPGDGMPMPKTPKKRHNPGDGMPMPKTPKKRHNPGDGMPMPPKALRRSPHDPDKDDGHFSMPQRSRVKASGRVLNPRHGPTKSPSPPKSVRRRSARPHGPSKSPSPPKRVRRSPRPHGPDDKDGHFSYPVDRVAEPEVEKRTPHGPDDKDGHFSYPVGRIAETDVEKRAPHGPDDDDGHFSYPVDRTVEAEVERREAHGPDDNDGHFSYPSDQ